MNAAHKVIANLLAEVNRRNAESVCSAEVRHGWNALLETVLMDNNLYCGFGYLQPSEVPEGQAPGMVKVGEQPGVIGPRPVYSFHDESRVYYFVHHKLQPKAKAAK